MPMPFEPLPDQDQPPIDNGVKIWRYVDIPKLAAMLSSRSLYFCQVPLLGDPFEGSLVQAVKNGIESMKPIVVKQYPGFVRTDEQMCNSIMSSKTYSYASCWYASEEESAAMWDLYARGGFGVTVRSTLGRLVDSVASVAEPVWIGKINYHNYATAQPPQNSLWTPMFQKRKSFEHEREIRALVMDWDKMNTLRGTWSYEPNLVPGRYVSADLSILLERVYVAPFAPQWYKDVIIKVVAALGFEWLPVTQSDMEASPILF